MPNRPTEPTPSVQSLQQAIERLQARESHLLNLLSLARDAVVAMDTQGRVTDWNPAAEKLLGFSRAEAVGAKLADLIVPVAQRAALEAGLQRSLATRQPTILNQLIEVEAQHRDGTLIAVELAIWSALSGQNLSFGAFIRDISDRRAAQEAIRLSEDFNRVVVEHLGEGMSINQNGVVLYVNRMALQILKRPMESVVGHSVLNWVHPDDHAYVIELRRQSQQGEGIPERFEIRCLQHDGSVRWLEAHASTIPWKGQSATMTFFSDITERKKIIDTLHRSEERYRLVIENVGEGMIVLQGDHIVFANARASEIARISPDEFLALGFLHRVHPDDHAIIQERRRRRLAGEDVINQYQIRLLQPDGEIQWLEIGVTVVPWEGQPATLTFYSDITDRKLLEQELHRTSSEREAILNSALVGIVLSRNREHEWVNEKFAEMVGYSRDELIGQSSRLVHASEAEWQAAAAPTRAALSTIGTFTAERQLRRKNGDLFWAHLAGRCVRPLDPDSGVIWTFLDITERKQAEQEIRDALERQKELNELRSRFVAMTSHEFRTPLATILSSAELLKYYGDRLPAQEKNEVIQSIESSVQRMTRMLDRVLLIGKVEAHMLEFKPTTIDLVALCVGVVAETRSQLPDSTCTVRTHIEDGISGGVYDEKLLGHILGNLISNAIKYSPNGGEVGFKVYRQAEDLVFEVSDQGIGIPGDEIAHLFESFHRSSNVGNIQGTGLGLAIVKNSVDLHGGRIEVRSELGKGTCFTVRLESKAA
ncbi:MAG: PAS domain S-box protein [Rhodoferax sp.]|nr:PAS domain S-box protein [Rhodoferax sp.]MCF8208683.1 PAS domain S-box protein [Rhodoferax sp.]